MLPLSCLPLWGDCCSRREEQAEEEPAGFFDMSEGATLIISRKRE